MQRRDANSEPGDPPARAAVALTYDLVGAPRITASGEQDLAARIIELALAADVPTFSNPELASVLSQLDIGTEVPEPLYRAVAEMISFAWLIREEAHAHADTNVP